jgi:hypothetical protein
MSSMFAIGKRDFKTAGRSLIPDTAMRSDEGFGFDSRDGNRKLVIGIKDTLGPPQDPTPQLTLPWSGTVLTPL